MFFCLFPHPDISCPAMEHLNCWSNSTVFLQLHECSNTLGVPLNCIFPVKNYHNEIDLNDSVNCLMLEALTQIVLWADDYVKRCSEKQKHVEWLLHRRLANLQIFHAKPHIFILQNCQNDVEDGKEPLLKCGYCLKTWNIFKDMRSLLVLFIKTSNLLK